MNFTKKLLALLLCIVMLISVLPIGTLAYASSEESENIFYLDGHKYQVFDIFMTWYEAKEYCESLGGHLATITSADEQAILNNADGNYWLGGTDNGSEGSWRWVTEEPWIYANWFEGEPNNEGEEHYLTTWDDHYWNDLCEDSYEQGGFICEWDNADSKSPIEIGDYITLGTYLGEPIVWRCVDIDENGPLMLSDKILCFKAFDAKGEHGNHYRNKEGTNNWNNSCLRHWLNTGNLIDWNTQTTKPSAENVFNGYNPYDAESGFMASFTVKELTLVKEIEQITYINELDRASADGGSGEYSPVSGEFGTSLADLESKFSGKMYQTSSDRFFAIDLIQAKNIYENLGGNYLTASPTTSAIANYNGQGELTSDSCYKYWLRSPSTNGMSYEVMMIVDSTEQINYMSAASVLNGNQYHAVGVRPAFYLNLENYDDSYDVENENLSMQQILGVYDGSYTATQGVTGLTLSIYRTQELLSNNLLLQKYADVANSCSVSSDENVAIFNAEDVKAIVSQHNEEYIALFNFFPIVDDATGEAPNPNVEEGLYTMTISYDATTGTYEFIGNQWIQHDTYAMADLKNITFTDNTLSGDVYGEYASWFWTEYGDVGDAAVCRGDILSGYRIDFECESTSLRIDETQQIKAFVKNNQGVLTEDAVDIMWFSNDESIAKITGENWGDNNYEYSVGTILGVSEGETEIYAKLGNNRIAVCTVTVKEKITIKKRTFDENIDYYTWNLDSSVYNPTLANMLAALSAAAYDEDEITNAYQSLGLIDDFSTHYYSIGKFDPNFCSYTIGFKDSEYSNEKICLITVRGSGSDSFSDWVYNFDIFTAEEKHQGFFAPALVICKKVGEILNNKGILPNDVKYVITGHSRGAAVGNLLAVELMEQGINAENVYNYNFACPDVACKADFPNYDNIFNLCNTDDLVAFVPGAICNSLVTQGASWDKYGQTYWFTKDVDGFFASHAMDLYLEFFDKQLNISDSDWPFEYESMASGVLTKVLCPVDVIITDDNGNSIASVINGEINYYENNREIIVFTDGDKKIIYYNGDANFYVSLIGTDEGTMTFSIEKCNLTTGEVSESKTFSDVVLEDGKTMYCPVSETTVIDDVLLFVVEEKDGELIYTHTIGTDGTETPMIETDSSNSSTGNEDPNKSKPSDTLGENNDASIFDRLESISKETIIIVAASVVGAILLIIICVIIKKKKG